MIQSGASYPFGTDQIMFFNNINLKFDFTHLGNQRIEVYLEFADFGGMENLEINGFPVFIGDLLHAPGNPTPK
jgi:hypothetical protein